MLFAYHYSICFRSLNSWVTFNSFPQKKNYRAQFFFCSTILFNQEVKHNLNKNGNKIERRDNYNKKFLWFLKIERKINK
jgi:hypothetical protein